LKKTNGTAFLSPVLPLISLALILWPPRVVPPGPRVERLNTKLGPVTVFFQTRAGENELGVPLYPGARVLGSSHYKVLTAQKKVGIWLAEALLKSKDPLEKVLAFYQGKLRGATLAAAGSTASLVRGSESKAIVVKLERKGEATTIEIKRVERGARVTSELGSPPQSEQPRQEASAREPSI
jgi:hypothetical protein